MRPRILFFDLETRKWASDLRPDDHEAGWEELRDGKGGASAIAVYDGHEKWLYLYDDHSIEACARHLELADVVVGYCSEKFDIPCIEGLIHRRLRLGHHVDLYQEIIKASTERGYIGHKGDFTLDSVCKRNIGRGKINHGSNARELARKGHWGKLFNYCSDDVHLTHALTAKIAREGGLVNPGGMWLPLVLTPWLCEGLEDA